MEFVNEQDVIDLFSESLHSVIRVHTFGAKNRCNYNLHKHSSPVEMFICIHQQMQKEFMHTRPINSLPNMAIIDHPLDGYIHIPARLVCNTGTTDQTGPYYPLVVLYEYRGWLHKTACVVGGGEPWFVWFPCQLCIVNLIVSGDEAGLVHKLDAYSLKEINI